MEYLNIIEENFSHSDYVAYLRGSILMWLLEDKPFDTAQFKLYADKLVEVMEEQSTDTTDDECHCLQTQAPEPTVDPDEPRVYKFKLGDRVIVGKGTDEERTGTIIRLPREGIDRFNEYLVELDDKDLGWEATVEDEGVSCKNAWYAHKTQMTPLEDTSKGLQAGKWYHTTYFTVEELQQLLPKGTTVETEKEVLYDGIETEPPINTVTRVVNGITTTPFGDKTLIQTTTGNYLKEWFKL